MKDKVDVLGSLSLIVLYGLFGRKTTLNLNLGSTKMIVTQWMLITHSISQNFSCMDILHSLSLSRAKNSCHALDPITNSMHHNFSRDGHSF